MEENNTTTKSFAIVLISFINHKNVQVTVFWFFQVFYELESSTSCET